MAPKYSFKIQARLPCALAAVHNFICQHDEEILEAEQVEADRDEYAGFNGSDEELDETPEFDEPSELRDSIAEVMWAEYVAICAARGDDGEGDDSDV